MPFPVDYSQLPTFTCALCGRTSHNLFDARHSYCMCCGSADLPKTCEHRAEPPPDSRPA